jgi:hypothetical protein
MIRNGEGSLEAASQRLAQALETLEARLQNRGGEGAAPEAGDLQAQLNAARERERALEEAAAEASAALGRAAEQIRAVIEESESEEA